MCPGSLRTIEKPYVIWVTQEVKPSGCSNEPFLCTLAKASKTTSSHILNDRSLAAQHPPALMVPHERDQREGSQEPTIHLGGRDGVLQIPSLLIPLSLLHSLRGRMLLLPRSQVTGLQGLSPEIRVQKDSCVLVSTQP